ncbi:MAG: alpha/beta hydrolase [Bacteroidales bacterium]|nr:alpha/beta hydrolase [Bacteroidales bacterium]
MTAKRSEGSPIAYFINDGGHSEWVLFLHAAFVTHGMFRTQFGYFRDRYNILAVDIIGHGLSSETRKGDSILKMSKWIYDIMQAEGIGKLHIIEQYWHRITSMK